MKKMITVLLVLSLCLCSCVAMPEDVELFDPLTTLETAASTIQETAEETTQYTTVATTTATTEAATEATADTTESTAITEAPTEPSDPEPTQKPQTHSQEEPVVNNAQSSDNTVWIPTKGGKKYHANAACSGMIGPEEVTKAEAESQGFTPCKKCYK